ncbi:phage major capsid protein [Streptomyces sp. NA02950]|uniref:phage major capsid protein n=1 Tax=Streptomyces sp. NA02950 TaxID=2742137 RepID=UPI001591968D|nr:phage major capsid protein [Streptomyces sp. NA02950]QKV94229.1 phage major capsid protein [Streptomyces sp. NA02950]
MDLETMRARLKLLAAKATGIKAKADAEKRDFTAEEATELRAILDEAQPLTTQIKTAQEGESLRKTLAELGDSIAAPTSRKADVHPRVKASGGTDWADTMLKTLGGPQGYKGILAGGTIAVSVPLDPEPVRMDVPVLSLRQLMPNVANTTGRFAYLRQTTRTNNAAAVAPGAKKPTSVYTLSRVDDRVRTIAHLSEPIAKQDLDDVAMLRQFIDQEMRLGLDLALEAQILNGDGTGENMTGIGNVSGSQAQAFTTDLLVTTRKAVTKLERYGYMTNAAFVMTPDDWEAIELLADNEARFYYGGPQASVNPAARRLWGAPVVVSESATTGTAYLADFSQMQLQVRQEGMLDWSENVYDPNALGAGSGASDFERNMLRFRFEGRFGLEILRPSAIVEVDLTAS